jgi:hypothetical protein
MAVERNWSEVPAARSRGDEESHSATIPTRRQDLSTYKEILTDVGDSPRGLAHDPLGRQDSLEMIRAPKARRSYGRIAISQQPHHGTFCHAVTRIFLGIMRKTECKIELRRP